MKNKDFLFAVVTNDAVLYNLQNNINVINVLKTLSKTESKTMGKTNYYIDINGKKRLDIEYPPIINTTYTLKK